MSVCNKISLGMKVAVSGVGDNVNVSVGMVGVAVSVGDGVEVSVTTVAVSVGNAVSVSMGVGLLNLVGVAVKVGVGVSVGGVRIDLTVGPTISPRKKQIVMKITEIISSIPMDGVFLRDRSSYFFCRAFNAERSF